MSSAKQKRKANFSETEKRVLLSDVEKYYSIINGKFGDSVTMQRKNETWKKITDHVNAASTCLRTVDEIKKKWEDLKTRTKRKATGIKKTVNETGNVPLKDTPVEQLTDVENRIVGLLGVIRTQGIDGGIDTDVPKDKPVARKPTTLVQENEEDTDDETQDMFDSAVTEDDYDLLAQSHRPRSTSTATSKRQRTPSPIPSTSARNKRTTGHAGTTVVSEQLLAIEKERLDVEKKRLQLEERRLDVEMRRLRIDEARWQQERDAATRHSTDEHRVKRPAVSHTCTTSDEFTNLSSF
ncbi:nuclear apoptosis-inducing factor 1-like [Lineus longissimus]|uniref:nuclear apoptosis-inducing factor 1-like n=1 Tax=Lineus longissimus TaxID=88925 RepID=UPI00315D7B9D